MPGWMSAIARFNPMTYLVNGVRAAMIGDLTSSTVLVGFATAAVGILAAFAASILTLARTLNRR